MANEGLRLALTIYGMFEFILPNILLHHRTSIRLSIDDRLYSILFRLRRTSIQTQRSLTRLKHNILERFTTSRRPLLELPYELRERIYQTVCTPNADGRVSGALNVLLINRQIYHEAKPIFDKIEHKISIGDLQRYKTGSVEFIGLPRIVKMDECFVWHMSSLKHLVLDVSVCSIGSMTPDCFDVYIANNGKDQWRHLKQLIGIWPETREMPLETIRLNLKHSEYDTNKKMYRADLIRVIRNFKRTQVWAETGDCSSRNGNKSKLLPLVRAFNQGRRNWLEDSTVDNNLIVRYERQMLPEIAIEASEEDKSKADGERQRWSIVPVNDTSRSDNSIWPEWTGKEEKYIYDKMIPRLRHREDWWECQECLAAFDCPGDLRTHISRGSLEVSRL